MNLDGDLVADLQLPCVGRGRGSAQPAESGEIPAPSRNVVPSEGEPGRLVCASEVALGGPCPVEPDPPVAAVRLGMATARTRAGCRE